MTSREVEEFNRRSSQNEQLVARSLMTAGITCPGVVLCDDLQQGVGHAALALEIGQLGEGSLERTGLVDGQGALVQIDLLPVREHRPVAAVRKSHAAEHVLDGSTPLVSRFTFLACTDIWICRISPR
jgi:hypothetical protein